MDTAAAPVPLLDGDSEKKNLFRWKAVIRGPKSTRYENAMLKLQIDFPYNYPFAPPNVKFVSPTIPPLHPNVNPTTGDIYIDVLSSSWSPAWNASSVLMSIQSILDNPIVVDPLPKRNGNRAVSGPTVNARATNLYIEHRNQYYNEVQNFVCKTYNLSEDEIDDELESMLLRWCSNTADSL